MISLSTFDGFNRSAKGWRDEEFLGVMIVIAGSVAGPASASCWLTVGSFGENPEQFVQYDSCSVSGPQNARSVGLMLRKVENPEVSPVTRPSCR